MALSLSETAVLIGSALRNHDVRAMRKINDRCIDETALKFQQPTYNYALVTYVLAKILSKPRYFKRGSAKGALSSIDKLLRACEGAAKEADYAALLAAQGKIIATMEKMDDEDRRFVKGIMQKARLKIASTLYAQGLSLGNASDIAGADKREVLLYAGQTMMFDRLLEKKGMEERLKELREIFS
jgi:hypothetical protein